jgi:predicted lipoprotein with Yx(FWY)xxD motif
MRQLEFNYTTPFELEPTRERDETELRERAAERERSEDLANSTLRLFYGTDLDFFYLTDSKHRSLYMSENDHIGLNFTESDFNITCYGECETRWPPLIVDEANLFVTVGRGLNATLVGSRLRQDGRLQLTYNNIPLYYYYLDRKPGDTFGQAIFDNNAFWYLIGRRGHPLYVH